MKDLKKELVNQIDQYILIALSVICVFVYNIFLSNFVLFSFNTRKTNDDKIEIYLKKNFNELYEQSKCSIFHKIKIYTKIVKFLFFLWLNNKASNKVEENTSFSSLLINQKQKMTI